MINGNIEETPNLSSLGIRAETTRLPRLSSRLAASFTETGTHGWALRSYRAHLNRVTFRKLENQKLENLPSLTVGVLQSHILSAGAESEMGSCYAKQTTSILGSLTLACSVSSLVVSQTGHSSGVGVELQVYLERFRRLFAAVPPGKVPRPACD